MCPQERLNFVPESFEFVSTYLWKLLLSQTYKISNISTLKRCHLQFTTWCVVTNEIFGPWMLGVGCREDVDQ